MDELREGNVNFIYLHVLKVFSENNYDKNYAKFHKMDM